MSDSERSDTGTDTRTGYAGTVGGKWTGQTGNREVRTGDAQAERIKGVFLLGQGGVKFSVPIQPACRSVTMVTPCLCVMAVNVSKTEPSDEADVRQVKRLFRFKCSKHYILHTQPYIHYINKNKTL